MAFSIRLTEQEKKIVDSYARLHSISLGEAFKQALFEKIEEEYDLAVFDDAYDEYKKNHKAIYDNFETFLKEAGL